MRSKNCFVFLLSFIFSLSLKSRADSLSIPIDTVKAPAMDLKDPKTQKLIEAGQLIDRHHQGEDLSLLNPENSKWWQNTKYPTEDRNMNMFPDGNTGVTYVRDESITNPKELREYMIAYAGLVEVKNQPGQMYRFSFSLHAHNVLMRAALLRKLGYYVATPKYYKRLKVQFESVQQMNDFLFKVQKDLSLDFEDRKWITEKNDTTASVVFNEALLEIPNNQFFNIHWGQVPTKKTPAGANAVRNYSTERPYRALILPFVLVDVPESPNRYSTQAGKIVDDFLVLTNPFATSFEATSIEDVRWLLRRMAELTQQDWWEIVSAGQFPQQGLTQLVYSKLIHRFKNLMELADLELQNSLPDPDLKFTSQDGVVRDGKVIQENIEGSPLRWAHIDSVKSPFQEGDLETYLTVIAKTSVISGLLNQVNEKLQYLTMSDIIKDRTEQIKERVINHIKMHPDEPLYQKIESWGGPLGGFGAYASRNLATGSYFGSTAPMQLVDSLTVSATLGWWETLAGIEKIIPVLTGNVAYVRNYVHVRPLTQLKDESKEAWTQILIPHFMKNISEVLVEDQNGEEVQQDPLHRFLLETLRENEVFTITDSLVGGIAVNLSVPIDGLTGWGPLSFANSLTLSGDANMVVTQQTSITRTKDGIQVHVRSIKNKAIGGQYDATYFISLLKNRMQNITSKVDTDAFVLDFDPNKKLTVRATEVEKNKAQKYKQDLTLALHALFKCNNADFLYSRFKDKKLTIHHDLDTTDHNVQVLYLKGDRYTEDHTLKLQYPAHPDYPQLNPKDEEITLFKHSIGELTGQDFLSLGYKLISGALNLIPGVTLGQVLPDSSPNPANTLYGSAHWRIIKAEADISEKRKQDPSMASTEYVWGGWSMSAPDFMELIDTINNKFKKDGVSYKSINKADFSNVKTVDFYRISAQLFITGEGLSLLTNKILHQDESTVVREVLSIIGEKDVHKGGLLFIAKCDEAYQSDTLTFNIGITCVAPWFKKILELSKENPADKKSLTRWQAQLVAAIDQGIPRRQLLKFLGDQNYIFVPRISGFREGDNDGDIELLPNSFGKPNNIQETASLFQKLALKSRVLLFELDRSEGYYR